jgi:NTE family protein
MIEKLRMRSRGMSVMLFRRRRGGLDAPGLSRGEISQMPRKSKRCRAGLLGALAATVALTAGCASTRVPMNEPLAAADGTGPSYRIEDLNRQGGAPDLLVFVSLSGGGKRSAAFAHGALRGMRDVPVALNGRISRLLDEVDQIAAVSGGSFPAAHFGLNGELSFETFPGEFLNRDIEAFIWGTFLLPWNWEWLFNPLYGTNDRMAEVYDRLMFRGASFADLARRGRPQIAIVATDISFGLPFAFTPQYFDVICSDLGSFPVARAVAASNGFPVLFPPVTLQNHRGRCPIPPPLNARAGTSETDLRLRVLAEAQRRYLDPEQVRWVHLMDGGIADNLAMRATVNTMLLIGRDVTQVAERLLPIRRILMVSVDGQAAADPERPRQRVVTGLGQILSAVSGAQIDNYNIETLLLAQAELAHLASVIRDLRCARAARIERHACDDVRGQVVHISLSDYPDEERRRRLQAIRTGLTIPSEDAAALVEAGETMIRSSAALRDFLAASPTAATARRAQPGR